MKFKNKNKYLSKCIFWNVAGIRTRLLKSSGNWFLKSLATSKASTNMLSPPSTSGSNLSIDKRNNVPALALLNSTRWLKTVTEDETGLASQWYQPLHYPPSPWNWWVFTHHWGLHPILFQLRAAWVLLRPKRMTTVKELWDGSYGLSSLSEKTRIRSNHL